MMSIGASPLTVQPTENAVPSISKTVPWGVFAIDRGRMVRAISMTWSRVMLPSCLMFFSFLRSRTGSLSALMIRELAEGTISTVAWRLMIVSLTVTFMPFQSMVAFWMSSPTFLGERPRGPILGASDDAEPISPPTARMITYLGGSFDGGGPMVLSVCCYERRREI